MSVSLTIVGTGGVVEEDDDDEEEEEGVIPAVPSTLLFDLAPDRVTRVIWSAIIGCVVVVVVVVVVAVVVLVVLLSAGELGASTSVVDIWNILIVGCKVTTVVVVRPFSFGCVIGSWRDVVVVVVVVVV